MRQSHHAENLAESSIPLLNEWSRSTIKKTNLGPIIITFEILYG